MPKKQIKKTMPVKVKAENKKIQPIFKSEPYAEKVAIKTSEAMRSKKSSQGFNIYQKIAFTFVGLAIILIIFVAYYAIGSVKIEVSTKINPVHETYNLNVVSRDSTDVESIKADFLEQIVTDKQTFDATEKEIKTGKAEGTITITNESTKAQPLVATTRFLSSDQKLFRLKESVTVPAKGKIEANIAADQEGEDYEIQPTKFTIPGLNENLQKIIYAESASQMLVPVIKTSAITQEDIDKARESLSDALLKKATESLNSQVQVGQTILIAAGDTLKEDISAKVGDENKQFTIDMTMKANGIIFNQDDLKNIAIEKLKQQIGENQFIEELKDENVKYTLKSIDMQTKKAVINVEVNCESKFKPSDNFFNKANIAGLSKEKAMEYFKSFGEIGDVNFNFSPSWVKKMPLFQSRINIELK